MTLDNRQARIAGLLYLIMAVTSAFGLKTLEGFATGDAAAVLARIEAGRTLFEFAILATAASSLAILLLGVALYHLFSPIGRNAAGLLLIFVICGIPTALAAVARQMDILSLLDGGAFGIQGIAGPTARPALSGEPLQVQVMLALYGYDNLMRVTCIFWGLWLIPIGWLMFRAGGAVPRVLGVLLVLGGVGYTLGFVKPVLLPHGGDPLFEQISFITLGIPALACELGTMLWLLIMGAPGPRKVWGRAIAARTPAPAPART